MVDSGKLFSGSCRRAEKGVPSTPRVEVPKDPSIYGLESIWHLPQPHPLPNIHFPSWKHNITQREAQALELAHQSNRKEAGEQQG